MILTPEVAGMVASIVGVLGLVLRKARCFIRRVGGSYDCGAGFCDGSIVPQISGSVKCESELHQAKSGRSASSYATEFLEKGPEFAVAMKSSIELAQTILPYVEPLILAL